MRRMASCVCTAVIAAVLVGPAAVEAQVIDTFDELDRRGLSPAPLVPTTAPPSLRPLDRTLTRAQSRTRRGYGLRISRDDSAIIVLEGGQFRTMKALLRDFRRIGFRRARTQVRGRRGYLLTRRLGPVERWLAWVEGGRAYGLGSGTPNTVSPRQLRSTAAGLDTLTGSYVGAPDPSKSSEAAAVTTSRTVTARVSWEAECTVPGATESFSRVGTAEVTLLPASGSAFEFDIATNRVGSEPWTGSVSGTIGADAIALTMRARGTIQGDECDSGPLSYSIRRARG